MLSQASRSRSFMPMLPAHKNLVWSFSIYLYVGFIPVGNLLDIFVSVWQNEFLLMFLFVTDTKLKFGWRVFAGPSFTKTFYVLLNPKVFDKNFHFIAFITIFWGCLFFNLICLFC
jgi:hypothetical protein